MKSLVWIQGDNPYDWSEGKILNYVSNVTDGVVKKWLASSKQHAETSKDVAWVSIIVLEIDPEKGGSLETREYFFPGSKRDLLEINAEAKSKASYKTTKVSVPPPISWPTFTSFGDSHINGSDDVGGAGHPELVISTQGEIVLTEWPTLTESEGNT